MLQAVPAAKQNGRCFNTCYFNSSCQAFPELQSNMGDLQEFFSQSNRQCKKMLI